MATVLYRKLGEQFSDNSGNRLIAGNVFYYQAGTSTLQATFSDQAGTIANPNPMVLNGDGRLTSPVYLGSVNDYKELVQDSNSATVNPWPSDNIPKAVATAISSTYALTSLPWVFVTSIASPVAPASTDAGKGYECDTTGGNIVFNLVSAATVGTGKGYTFKKTGSANTLTIDANGAELIDGAATLVISNKFDVFSIVSDGAGWQVVAGVIRIGLPGAVGLTVKNNAGTPNTKIDVTVSQAILTTSAGIPIFYSGGTNTIDCTITGANALDAGSLAASTWYYVYLISDGTNFKGLASLSSTAPTMPANYIYSMRVGEIQTDASVHFTAISQVGNRITYTTQLAITASGSAQGISPFFPPTCQEFVVLMTNNNTINSIGSVSDHLGIVRGGETIGSGGGTMSMDVVVPNLGANFTANNAAGGNIFRASGWRTRVNAT